MRKKRRGRSDRATSSPETASKVERKGMMRYAAAAEYLGMAKGTLANSISARTGPRSVKMGRSRMFRQEDLDDFIEEKLIETERLEKRRARRRGRAAMVITCANPDRFLISIMMIAAAVLLLVSFLHTQ